MPSSALKRLQACKLHLPGCFPAGFQPYSAGETPPADRTAGRRKKPFFLCFWQHQPASARPGWSGGGEFQPRRQSAGSWVPTTAKGAAVLPGAVRLPALLCVQSSQILTPPDLKLCFIYRPSVCPFSFRGLGLPSSIPFPPQQEPCPGTQSRLASTLRLILVLPLGTALTLLHPTSPDASFSPTSLLQVLASITVHKHCTAPLQTLLHLHHSHSFSLPSCL